MTRFATDTAVVRDQAGRYHATIDPGWWIERGPNGGYLAAIVLRAVLAEVDDPERRLRTCTLHYLRPPVEGRVRCTSPSSGRAEACRPCPRACARATVTASSPWWPWPSIDPGRRSTTIRRRRRGAGVARRGDDAAVRHPDAGAIRHPTCPRRAAVHERRSSAVGRLDPIGRGRPDRRCARRRDDRRLDPGDLLPLGRPARGAHRRAHDPLPQPTATGPGLVPRAVQDARSWTATSRRAARCGPRTAACWPRADGTRWSSCPRCSTP